MKNETVAKKKVDVSSFALYIGAVLILICFTTVSYTHLDVYKRQTITWS